MIESKRASEIPGDDLRELTAPATDDTGRTWPAGTTFRPLSRGTGGQVVTIDGERVTFAE